MLSTEFVSIVIPFFISALILVISFLFITIQKHKTQLIQNTIGQLLIASIIALTPLYFVKHYNSEEDTLNSILLSFISSIHAISYEDSVHDIQGIATGIHLENDENFDKLSDKPFDEQFNTSSKSKNESTFGQAFAKYYSALLHLLILLFVGGFILSLFKNFFSKAKYYLSYGQLCVFTEFSERSYLLAKDIRNSEQQNKKRHVIVFLNTPHIEDHTLYSPKEIRALNAIFFNMDSDEFKILPRFYRIRKKEVMTKHQCFFRVCSACLTHLKKIKRAEDQSKYEDIHFFLLSLEDASNLQALFKLYGKYKEESPQGKILVHVLSDLPESENIVDSLENIENFNLRLIKESRAIFYELFDERPLFLGRRGNTLKILVVGAGRNGLEAVKIASWCGQTIQLKPEIHVIDSNPSVAQEFYATCPELGENADDFAKSESKVIFHILDINSPEFLVFLRNNNDIGYVICALGDDELSLKISLLIRRVFEENVSQYAKNNENFKRENDLFDTLPLINTILNNSFFAQTVHKLKFDTKDDCHIHAIGDLENRYTWDNIVSPCFAVAGQSVNRFYEKKFGRELIVNANDEERSIVIKQIENIADTKYEDKEYNRASSVALAVHSKYKIYSAMYDLEHEFSQRLSFDCITNENNSTFLIDWTSKIPHELLDLYDKIIKNPQHKEALARLEHTRWNVYTRSLGWRKLDHEYLPNCIAQKNNHRDFSAKLHACLVSWEELNNVDDILEKNGKDKSNFQVLDTIFIEKMTEILKEAQQADEKNTIIQPKDSTCCIRVGVTGHRNLNIDEAETYKSQIKAILKELKASKKVKFDIRSKSKNTETEECKLEICSCLSDGADRLVVNVGLAEKCSFQAFSPFSINSPLQGQGLRSAEIVILEKEIKELKKKNKTLAEEQIQEKQEINAKVNEKKIEIRIKQKDLQLQSQKALQDLASKSSSCQIFGQDVEQEIIDLYNRIEELKDLEEQGSMTSLQKLELEDKKTKIQKESHKVYLASGKAMLENSDILITLWDGKEQKDKGSTYDIIKQTKAKNKKIYWVKVEKI